MQSVARPDDHKKGRREFATTCPVEYFLCRLNNLRQGTKALGIVYRTIATHLTPAKRGKVGKPEAADGQDEQTPVQRHAAMTWAQRLKRVFNIDVERCRICGCSAKVIACIEDPVVIKKILMHLEEKAPPQSSLFG
jgi:hypothetical protein